MTRVAYVLKWRKWGTRYGANFFRLALVFGAPDFAGPLINDFATRAARLFVAGSKVEGVEESKRE